MSNVQEALKAALAAIDLYDYTGTQAESELYAKAESLCKAALAEIEKCEPVAKLGRWMIDKSTGTDILTLDNCSVIEGKYANYIMGLLQKEIDKVVSELENTSPQPRDWVGLSDDDISDIHLSIGEEIPLGAISATEAKLKQLNTKG